MAHEIDLSSVNSLIDELKELKKEANTPVTAKIKADNKASKELKEVQKQLKALEKQKIEIGKNITISDKDINAACEKAFSNVQSTLEGFASKKISSISNKAMTSFITDVATLRGYGKELPNGVKDFLKPSNIWANTSDPSGIIDESKRTTPKKVKTVVGQDRHGKDVFIEEEQSKIIPRLTESIQKLYNTTKEAAQEASQNVKNANQQLEETNTKIESLIAKEKELQQITSNSTKSKKKSQQLPQKDTSSTKMWYDIEGKSAQELFEIFYRLKSLGDVGADEQLDRIRTSLHELFETTWHGNGHPQALNDILDEFNSYSEVADKIKALLSPAKYKTLFGDTNEIKNETKAVEENTTAHQKNSKAKSQKSKTNAKSDFSETKEDTKAVEENTAAHQKNSKAKSQKKKSKSKVDASEINEETKAVEKNTEARRKNSSSKKKSSKVPDIKQETSAYETQLEVLEVLARQSQTNANLERAIHEDRLADIQKVTQALRDERQAKEDVEKKEAKQITSSKSKPKRKQKIDVSTSEKQSSSSTNKETEAVNNAGKAFEKTANAKRKYKKANEEVDEANKNSSKSISEEEKELKRLLKTAEKSQDTLKNLDWSQYTFKPDALKAVQEAFESLAKTDIKSLNADGLKDYTKKVKTFFDSIKLDKLADPQKISSMMSKISTALSSNSNFSKGAQNSINAYYKEIASGAPISARRLKEIGIAIDKITSKEQILGHTGNSVFTSFSKQLKSANAQLLTMFFSWQDWIRYARTAFDTVHELDTALIDLKKTTAMNSDELADFYRNSSDVAKEMGNTTKGIIDQAAAWSRLGYNTKEQATEMAKLSSQFASISPGMNVEDAQTGLVSIMKAWDVDVDKVERDIMDNINTLGNKFAENNSDIISGMERAGATFAAIGMSIEDSFALFTGAQEVIQNAEVVGTALKTLSLRIRGYDEDTEQLSEDVVKATGKVASLTQVASNGYAGISLWKDASQTEYKSLVQYLGEISEIWDEIDAKSQTQLLDNLFGKRGASVGSAIIKNFDQVKKALEEMEGAAGSADREMNTIRESLDYKLNNLKETWVGIVQELMDSGKLGQLIDALTKISEALGWIIEKAGPIGVLLSGFLIQRSLSDLSKTRDMLSSINTVIITLFENHANLSQFIKRINDLTGATKSIKNGFDLATSGAKSFVDILKTLFTSPAFLTMVGFAATLFVAKKAWDALNVTVSEIQPNIDEINSKISSLNSELEQLRGLENRTDAQEQRLSLLETELEIQQTLLEVQERRKALESVTSDNDSFWKKFTDKSDEDNYTTKRKSFDDKYYTPGENQHFIPQLQLERDKVDYQNAVNELKNANDELAKTEEGTRKWEKATKRVTDAQKEVDNLYSELSDNSDSAYQEYANILQGYDDLRNALEKFDKDDPRRKIIEDETHEYEQRLKILRNYLAQIAQLQGKDISSLTQSGRFEATNLHLTDDGRNSEDMQKIAEYTKSFNSAQKEAWITATNGARNAEEAIEKYETHIKYLQKTGNNLGVDTIISSVDTLSTKIKPQFDELAEAYNAIFHGSKGFDLEVVDTDMMEKISASFTKLGDEIGVSFEDGSKAVNKFLDTITSAETKSKSFSEQQKIVQDAFNELATAYFNSADGLANVNKETADAIEQQLEQMGIVNAHELVTNKLTEAQAKLAFQEAITNGVSLEQYADLLNQADASDVARLAAFRLAVQEAKTAMVDLNTKDKIQKIRELGEEYLSTAEKAAFAAKMDELEKSAASDGHFDTSDVLSAIDEIEATFSKIKFTPKYDSKGAGKSGKEAADAYVEAYEKEVKKLDTQKEKGLLTERQYLEKLKALNEKYFKDNAKYAEKYAEVAADYAQKLLSHYNSVISGVTTLLSRKISALQKSKDAAIKSITAEKDATLKALNKEKEAMEAAYKSKMDAIQNEIDGHNEQIKTYQKQQKAINKVIKAKQKEIKELEKFNKAKQKEIKAIEKENKVKEKQKKQEEKFIKEQQKVIKINQKEIDSRNKQVEALQEQIDALNKVNEARKDSIEMQKAEYDLQRKMNQRTKLVYTGEQGQMRYEADESEVRNARENLDDQKEQAKVKAIQKKIDGLNEEIKSYNKIIESYQTIIDEHQEIIDGIDEYLAAKQEIIETLNEEIAAQQEIIDSINEYIESQQEIVDHYQELIDNIQESIDVLQEQKDALQKAMDKESEMYEKRIKETEEMYAKMQEDAEKYWDALIDKLETTKSKWEELAEVETVAKAWHLVADEMAQFGFTVDDVLNDVPGAFDKFKDVYIKTLSNMNGGTDQWKNAVQYAAKDAQTNYEAVKSSIEAGKGATDELVTATSGLQTAASNVDTFATSLTDAGTATSDLKTASEGLANNYESMTNQTSNITAMKDAMIEAQNQVDAFIQKFNEEDTTVSPLIQGQIDKLGELHGKLAVLVACLSHLTEETDLSGITGQFDDLATAIKGVSDNLQGNDKNSILSSLQEIAKIDIEPLIKDFDALTESIKTAVGSISGGGGAGKSDKGGEQSGNKGDKGGGQGASGTLISSIEETKKSADRNIGVTSTDEGATVIGDVNQLGLAVKDVLETKIGLTGASADDGTFIGGIVGLHEKADEHIGKQKGDTGATVIGDFNQLGQEVTDVSENHVGKSGDGSDKETLVGSVKAVSEETTKDIAGTATDDFHTLHNAVVSNIAKVKKLHDELDSLVENSPYKVTIEIETKGAIPHIISGGQFTGTATTGQAYATGSAHVEGTAKMEGDWGVQQGGRSLVGELGQELMVMPGGRFKTIGDAGPEFIDVPKGSVIFNHLQTRQLLSKKNLVMPRGMNGKAFASGSASSAMPALSQVPKTSATRRLQEKLQGLLSQAVPAITNLSNVIEKQTNFLKRNPDRFMQKSVSTDEKPNVTINNPQFNVSGVTGEQVTRQIESEFEGLMLSAYQKSLK